MATRPNPGLGLTSRLAPTSRLSLLALVACGSSAVEPHPATDAIMVETLTAPARAPAAISWAPLGSQVAPGSFVSLQSVEVSWEALEATHNCFFFSGPAGFDGVTIRQELDGPVRLERQGETVTLRFEGRVELTGSVRGDRLELGRQARHDHDQGWTSTERITGTFNAGAIEGRYTYEECDLAAPASCPGRCTLEATIRVRPTHAP